MTDVRPAAVGSVRSLGVACFFGSALLVGLVLCEWIVLTVKIPPSSGSGLFRAVLWSMVLHGMVGCAAGLVVSGLTSAVSLVSGKHWLPDPESRLRVTWALILAGTLGL